MAVPIQQEQFTIDELGSLSRLGSAEIGRAVRAGELPSHYDADGNLKVHFDDWVAFADKTGWRGPNDKADA